MSPQDINQYVLFPPERSRVRQRHAVLILRCVCIFALLLGISGAAPVTTPLPADIASRLAVRAAAARKANTTVRAYRLYSEAAKLDPLNANYRENRDELEPLAKLLIAQNLESADIKADIDACTLEATPGSDAAVAVRLADKAEKARKAGQAVRAYLLYAAAAARYPDNPDYRRTGTFWRPWLLCFRIRSWRHRHFERCQGSRAGIAERPRSGDESGRRRLAGRKQPGRSSAHPVER